MQRNELFVLLIKNFYKDLVTCLKPFQNSQDRANFLETLLEYLNGVYNYELPNPEYNFEGYDFDSGGFIRKEILHKFREKAKPFLDTQLRLYFEKDESRMASLFKKIGVNETLLSTKEYEDYTNYLHNILTNLIEKILTDDFDESQSEIERELKALPNNEKGQNNGFKSSSREYSRARQALLLYYLLKLLGKGRLDNSTRKNAQFGHALFGWPIDNIDNSALYRMLKKAPLLKEDPALLKDLEFVRMQFELLGSPEGVLLVQKEIDSIKRS